MWIGSGYGRFMLLRNLNIYCGEFAKVAYQRELDYKKDMFNVR
jgi:hypothetical protein